MQNAELRIIIIDDNPSIHQDVIKVLTAEKRSKSFDDLDSALFGENAPVGEADNYLPEFQFETASQGREGVHKIIAALREKRPYALAFVDIRMPPGWDGIETIKHIWKVDRNIQIVICTAFSDYTWEDTINELGMSDNFLILKKPFDQIAVRQLACALTKKWLLAKKSKEHTEFLDKTVKEKTSSLSESLSLLRATLESTEDGVLVVDLNKKIIDYNMQLIKIWDVSQALLDEKNEELIQEFFIDKIQDSDDYKKALKELYHNVEDISKHEIKLKSGKILECCSHPHRLNDATIGRVWSFRDITDRAFLEKELEYQATHDVLTDLPNRSLLYDRIKQAIITETRYNKSIALLFFDLDRFKLVNDSLGHEFGDKLLCAVAKRLLSKIRNEDTLARLGGDEFVLVLSKLSHDQDIINIAEKIISSFDQLFIIDGHDITITSSIGISLFPRDGSTPGELLKNADLAMYQAKEQGGNQFVFYMDKLSQQSSKKFTKETELREAIKNNEFFLLYQPEYEIDSTDVLSVEALIRWQHPKKGLILPIAFIPAAEDSGLIVPIGEWVIREACKQIKAWHAEGLHMIRVAVNVSSQQLKQTNFAEKVQQILTEFDVPAKYLEIEITENVVITHVEVIHMINQLKALGVNIVLDDFGTGNSSLNYLKHIHIDRLKIDRSFVRNISRSHSDEVIIEAIIAMSKSLNFKVLAEGVETQGQLDFLKSKNCDEVQGFFYSQPLSSSSISNYVNAYEKIKADKLNEG